jgi:hypothetical protein
MFIAALISVVMGVDVVDTTPVRIAARPPAEPIRHEAAPMQAPIPSPPALAQPARQPASSPAVQPMPSAQQQAAPQLRQSEPAAVENPGQAPACNIAACTAAYRTFTAADCTYQPTEGPRRLCSK